MADKKTETMKRVEMEIKALSVDFKPRNQYVACVVMNLSKTDTIIVPNIATLESKVDNNLYVLAVSDEVKDLKPGDKIKSAYLKGGCLTMPDPKYGEIFFIEQHRIIAVEKR